MSEGTLKATRLCKSYGKKDVLCGLDLELLPGGKFFAGWRRPRCCMRW